MKAPHCSSGTLQVRAATPPGLLRHYTGPQPVVGCAARRAARPHLELRPAFRKEEGWVSGWGGEVGGVCGVLETGCAGVRVINELAP